MNNFWSVWSESRSDLQSGQPSSQPRESEWGPSAVRDASLHDQRGSHHGGQAQVQLQPRYPVDWRPHCWPALVRPTPQRGGENGSILFSQVEYLHQDGYNQGICSPTKIFGHFLCISPKIVYIFFIYFFSVLYPTYTILSASFRWKTPRLLLMGNSSLNPQSYTM